MNLKHSKKVGIEIPEKNGFMQRENLINAGNKLRTEYGNGNGNGNGILAELAINKIRLEREKHKDESNNKQYAPRRIVHIIDSIKNQEELALLKLIYRDMLYVVGVFSPLNNKVENLKKCNLHLHEIYKLIDRDSGEEIAEGQKVSETFSKSDFFLRTDEGTDSELKERVERFLQLILGTAVITPTTFETAMYSASMASANSACLSRQVGAAVTDKEGDILSIGWNDVPTAGGGLYRNKKNDRRCWNEKG